MCQELEQFLLLSGIKVSSGGCTTLGINPEGCPYYDGSIMSICDPILNGRNREPGTYTFHNCDSFAYTGDVKAAPFEYGSIDEWLCSENYDVSQDDWKRIYNRMLRFASQKVQLDTVRANCLELFEQMMMARAFMSGA